MRIRGLWAAVAALMMVAGPASAKSVRVKAAAHGGVVKVAVGKKTLTYYAATVARPVEAVLAGPTRLSILARDLAPEPGSEPVTLKIEIEGMPPATMSLKPVTSKDAAAGGKAIGVLAKRSFEIAEGKHRVRILPSEAGSSAAVRLMLGTAKKAKTEWVPFAPEKFEKALRLRTGDTEMTCYRFTAASPVEMPVIGPLRMRVDTRIEFGMSDGTTKAYVVKTLLDGKPWKSFTLKSRASHTSSYPEMAEVTPGRAEKIALDVPAGRHRVSVLLNGDGVGAATAAVRVVKAEVGAAR